MTDKIKQLYNEGKTYEEMCNILGLTMAELTKEIRVLVLSGELVARTNNWGRKYKPRLTEEQKQKILEMYFEQKKTKLETIAHFGIHKTTFDRLVRKAIQQGLYKPKKRGFPKGKYKGWQLKGK